MQYHSPGIPKTYIDATPDAENAAVNTMIVGAMRAGKPWHEMARAGITRFSRQRQQPHGRAGIIPTGPLTAPSRGPAGPLDAAHLYSRKD